MSQAGRKGDQRGGLGGDPPSAPGRAHADPGDREAAGDLAEHGAAGPEQRGGAEVSAKAERFGQAASSPVLVIAAGYSRWITATMLPTKTAADLLAGHWRLLTGLGAVPRALVWNKVAAVGFWRGGRNQLTETFAAFTGLLGVRIIQCRPGDPETKELVARVNGRPVTSFLPGRMFASPPASTSSQPTGWPRPIGASVASRRPPSERIETDRPEMLLLPVDPPGWWHTSLRPPRDQDVRPGTNDLLHPPSRERPPHRGGRRPGPGPGVLRGHRGGPARPRLGLATSPSPSPPRQRPRRPAANRPGTGPRLRVNSTPNSGHWTLTTRSPGHRRRPQHREDPPSHRPGHPGLPGRTPGRLRHSRPVGRPPCRRPPGRPPG